MTTQDDYDARVRAHDDYIDRLEAQIAHWNAEIDRVENEAREVDGDEDVRSRYARRLSTMRMQRERMREHLREVREYGIEAYEDLRDHIDAEWQVMAQTFDEAAGKAD